MPSDRFIWVPFGLRAVLPLAHGRIELSAGGGGLYEKYSVSNPESGFGLVPRQGWGGYASARAAVAVDHRRRFWLGVTPRLMVANPPYARDRWFVLTGDIGLRFWWVGLLLHSQQRAPMKPCSKRRKTNAPGVHPTLRCRDQHRRRGRVAIPADV